MKVLIVGLGVQGQKRLNFAGSDVVATVDPVSPNADYQLIGQVPLDLYDGVLLCIPDASKIEIITYLLKNGNMFSLRSLFFPADSAQLKVLKELSVATNTTCYTAYNHRFEPHFVKMKELIDSGSLGQIYSLRMFYGNGTARLVRNSVWRDNGAGVLPDLGSHLLDTMIFWFGKADLNFKVHSSNCFENKSPDHVVFGARSNFNVQMEVALLSWRNHFYADIFAENASVHIDSLCKWGPSQLSVRERQLPSGRPNEKIITLLQPDPTWALEYNYFKELCKAGKNNIDNDILINDILNKLSFEVRQQD